MTKYFNKISAMRVLVAHGAEERKTAWAGGLVTFLLWTNKKFSSQVDNLARLRQPGSDVTDGVNCRAGREDPRATAGQTEGFSVM